MSNHNHNHNYLKLSDNPSLEQINVFEETNKGKVLEIRSKFGMLLALGTSVSSFHKLKDRTGKFVFTVEYEEVLNYDTLTKYPVRDIIIKPYEKREFIIANEKVKRTFENAESYWGTNYEDYMKSNSLKKDFPHQIIEGY